MCGFLQGRRAKLHGWLGAAHSGDAAVCPQVLRGKTTDEKLSHFGPQCGSRRSRILASCMQAAVVLWEVSVDRKAGGRGQEHALTAPRGFRLPAWPVTV